MGLVVVLLSAVFLFILDVYWAEPSIMHNAPFPFNWVLAILLVVIEIAALVGEAVLFFRGDN